LNNDSLFSKTTLYYTQIDSHTGEKTPRDLISYHLLNREIGFGPEGIDDFNNAAIGSQTFLDGAWRGCAEFLPNSIPLYPTMLDKDGHLSVNEASIGGVIKVDTCAVGNIMINNDQILLGTGEDKDDGISIEKSDLKVGRNLRVSSGSASGMAVRGIRVGTPLDVTNIEDGSVIADTLNATTKVETPVLNATTRIDTPKIIATNVNATDINATRTDSDSIKCNSIILYHDTENKAYFQANNADMAVYWNMLLNNAKPLGGTGDWQGIQLDCRASNLQNNGLVLAIGKSASSWGSAKFRVTADGVLQYPHIVGPMFEGVLYRSDGAQFLQIFDDCVRMIGTWEDKDGNIVTTSDARAKHDIESLDERYDIFFDNLAARRFKYNIGTSDRYHTGYITQGVQEALATAEISENEFAGIVTLNQDTDDEESALRYYEFVSLNTDQIQKLKRRVDTLEAKNAELEERLAKLEALLNNNAE
jgi:hypothetical protein